MRLGIPFWWDDELNRISGLSKISYDLGHVPAEESVEMLRGRDIGRVVYTHLNHTNPLLDPSQPIMMKLRDAGFEVAHDGMKLKL